VLVVDDQQDLADVTVEILKAYGMNAVAAYSADEALAILRGADNIDAMLSDIMMPGTNGIELANTAVAELPHLKVVLTSGYVFGSAALQTHGFPFFNKPYNMQAVLAHILDGSASAD
jgi:CheY-like chemotaxis protein